jgi:hypothetical protein
MMSVYFCGRALEMFAETLLVRANDVTTKRGARTLTPSHLKFCIESESRFDFLRELVATVPDLQQHEADTSGEPTATAASAGLLSATAGGGGGGGGLPASESYKNTIRQAAQG